MRQVASGRQNRDLEVAFDLTESTEFLDGRHRSLLSPDKKRRLTETAERVSHIDVQIAGEVCRRRVTGPALMRCGVVNLDQLATDNRIVRVGILEIATKLRTRDESVEHRGSGNRSVDRESAGLPADAYRLVESNQPRRRNERNGGEAMRITRREHDRVSARERRRDENRRLIDYSAHEIGDE